jgi:hypothetical protein
MVRLLLLPLFVLAAALPVFAEDKPLAPLEARKKVGEKITVEMKVQVAKDRLEKRGEIYLDAETDFRDPKNFAVIITKAGAAKLKEAGIDDPAAHFKDKIIRASGEVKLVQEVPRIEIDDPKQIRVVEPKEMEEDVAAPEHYPGTKAVAIRLGS